MGRWWSDAYLLYIRSSAASAHRLQLAACSTPVHALEAQYDDRIEDDEL
jgi:hypothetical protein